MHAASTGFARLSPVARAKFRRRFGWKIASNVVVTRGPATAGQGGNPVAQEEEGLLDDLCEESADADGDAHEEEELQHAQTGGSRHMGGDPLLRRAKEREVQVTEEEMGEIRPGRSG